MPTPRRMLLSLLCLAIALPTCVTVADGKPASPSAEPPGVVIDHVLATTRQYVGSPSIAILPDGSYVASHDLFGSGTTFSQTRVFASRDRGLHWRHQCDIKGAFWSTLFVHRGALYMMGTDKRYGDTVIRRSTDGGATWTEPKDEQTGRLTDDGGYHCGTQPVLVHKGRIWRAMEDNRGGEKWGRHFRVMMFSAPEDADLLKAESWTISNALPGNSKDWLDGRFGGWLEGNAVAMPDGSVVDLLRVEYPDGGGKAAIVNVSDDGRTVSFDPQTGFIDMPGGCTKFTVRFDPQSNHYWSLANWIPQRHQGIGRSPGSTRNTLALIRSADLRKWEVRALIAYHPEVKFHGFQYPDWQFDGDDLVGVSRTAYDDPQGGAHNYHDANYLTFHRVVDFRQAQGVELPPPMAWPSVTVECDDFLVEGHNFEAARLANDATAFGNRKYVWKDVPELLDGWQYTRTDGGLAARVFVRAKRDTTVYVARAIKADAPLPDWRPLSSVEFYYTDSGKTRLSLLSRKLKAGQQVEVPQLGWAGTLLLLPPKGTASYLDVPVGLQRMPYNNAGLTVDLGVGLWAWPLPMDYDGDGDLDLVVSCSDKPSSGVYLFENPGKGKKPASGEMPASKEMPVFKKAVRLGNGLRNACICYPDGQPRVLVPGSELIDFRRTGFGEQKKIYPTAQVHPNRTRANQWTYVDYDGDGRLDLVVGVGDWTDYGWDDAFDAEGHWTRGPLHGYVYLIRNRGSNDKPEYEKPAMIEAGGKAVDVFGMPSPSFADFDGDGDLDLMCGEFVDSFTYFQNIGSRKAPRYAAGKKPMLDGAPLRMDLCMIVPVAIDFDDDGDVDLVVGQEDGRVALLEHTGKLADGVPVFLAPKFFQQQADCVKFGALATPVGVDLDHDGDDDLVAGNSAGYIAFIENLGMPRGAETPRWAPPVCLEADGQPLRILAGYNGSIQGPCEAKWGYTTLSVADWDLDGLEDLVVNSIWGKVVWYRNIGTRTQPKFAAAEPIEVAWQSAPPKPAWNWWNPEGNALATQWRTTPVVYDVNGDGLNDLVVLDHEGYLAFFERTRTDGKLTLLPPKRIFQLAGSCDALKQGEPLVAAPMQLNSGTAGKSGRRKLCMTDCDGDGRVDLLANSINADLLRNVSTKKHPWTFCDAGTVDSLRLAGHTTSPTVVDFDGNGQPDLLLGAEDGYFYYLLNPWAQK